MPERPLPYESISTPMRYQTVRDDDVRRALTRISKQLDYLIQLLEPGDASAR